MCSTGERDEGGIGDPAGADDGPGGSGGFGEPVFVVPDEAGAVIDALAVLAAADVRCMDDDTLLGLFDGAESMDRLFHSARFAVLSELDARDLTIRKLGHVVANEAGWRHGASPARVRRDLMTAKALQRHLPYVAEALTRGDIPVDRARELALRVNDRNSLVLGSIQAALINLAQAPSTYRQFVLDVEQLCRLTDEDGPEPAPTPANHGSMSRSGDRVSTQFDLHGSRAIDFASALDAEADRLYREAVAERDNDASKTVPPRSQLLGDAVMNLCESGHAHRHSGRQAPAASFAIVIDATAEEAHHLFHNGTLLPGPTVAGPIDWSKRARLIDGTRLRYAAKEWELLTCDAEYSTTITAAGGHPVACQPGSRLASRQQRRNVEYRDGHCCFPGCDAPVNWCDAHHVRHHNNGGPTETPNLALLCRRHHGIIHSNGWSMEPNPDPGDGDGYYRITTPTGAVLHTRHHRGPGWRTTVPA